MKTLRMLVMVLVLLVVCEYLFAIEGTFNPISDEVLDSKPMRALYNPISKTWVKSVGILGRPASEIWAYLAFEGAGATTSFVTGGLGSKLTKDALFKVAENYVNDSPEVICKQLASSMMDTGLEAYERNYTRYKVWKEKGDMSQSERVAFTKDNYTSNYLGFGKDLWADVMSYKYKQGEYFSDKATIISLLKEIASLKSSISTTIEVFDDLKKIVELVRIKSLKTYAPYNNHLERIKDFEDRMGVGFSLAKREEVLVVNSGMVTLRDCDNVMEMFSFKEGGVINLRNFDDESLSESEMIEKLLSIDMFFDMPHGLGTNNKQLGEEELIGSAGIVDMGELALDKVLEAPAGNYKPALVPAEIKEGHSYCIKTASGKNYGKIEILEFYEGDRRSQDGFVKFKWEYQPKENVRKFDVVEPKENPTESTQYRQVENASREEMKSITATLEKLSQAQFDAFDKEFLQLLWLKAEDNNVLIKVIKTHKISNGELVDSAKDAAFYDWNLYVLKETGIMSWNEVRRITNVNTRNKMKRP